MHAGSHASKEEHTCNDACHANIGIRHYEGMHDRTPANIENHIPAIAMGHHICTRALQPQPQPAPGARSSQPQPWRPAPESASHSQAPGARRPEIPRHQPTYVQSKNKNPTTQALFGEYIYPTNLKRLHQHTATLITKIIWLGTWTPSSTQSSLGLFLQVLPQVRAFFENRW